MDLKLTVTCELEGEHRSFDLEFQADSISIGRGSANDVQLPDRQISSRHALIRVEDGRLSIEDLDSSNGTEVGGNPAPAHEKVPFELGAEIRIASYRLVVERPAADLGDMTAEKTDIVAMKMVREVLGSFGGQQEPPYLEVTNDGERGSRLDLDVDEGEYRIGREKGCDLTLKHWSISRRHALVRKSFDEVTVIDLESKNGVTVNGDRVTTSRRIQDGDIVGIGHTEIRFTSPTSSFLDSLDEPSTAIESLEDLGLDVSEGADEPSETAPPRKEPSPVAAEERAPPPAAPREPFREPEPVRRRPPAESSFADYLPLIVGIALAVAAVGVALAMFVL